MFSGRLRTSERIIEYALIYDISDSSKGCQLEYAYPISLPNVENDAENLKEFVLPCSHKNTLSEEYTLIFTDSDGKLDFLTCVCLPTSGYIVCLRSSHPWFELFHAILLIVNQQQLYSVTSRHLMSSLIDNLSVIDGNVEIPPLLEGTALSKIMIPIPDSHSHPFYHRYILEYYNTLSVSNWIIVFESLLLEKSIIFYSTRFQRITSCVLASLSLLYPLTWVHLVYPLLPPVCVDILGCPSPFIAGIHACAVEKVKEVLNEGVRLVDLDNDVIYLNGSSEQRIPSVMRQWVLRRCFSAHHSILRRKQTTQEAAAAALVEPFLEAMAILLGGYRDAMTKDNLNLCKSGTPNKTLSNSEWTFDSNNFVTSKGRECQAYLRELLHSQMVQQFIESRLNELNSDLGMIPSDDFEDCISRVPGPSRSNLSDLLGRGRRGFGRLAKQLVKVKLKRRNQKRSKSVPQVKPPSESSSSESEPSKTNEPPTQTLSATPAQPSYSRKKSPVGDAARLNIPRSQRSLLTSIFANVRDLPEDWLNCEHSRSSQNVSQPPENPNIEPIKKASSDTVQTSVAAVKDNQNLLINLWETFEPYQPEPLSPKRNSIRTMANQPSQTTQQPDGKDNDLSSFLRMLDPLSKPDHNGNLLQ